MQGQADRTNLGTNLEELSGAGGPPCGSGSPHGQGLASQVRGPLWEEEDPGPSSHLV